MSDEEDVDIVESVSSISFDLDLHYINNDFNCERAYNYMRGKYITRDGEEHDLYAEFDCPKFMGCSKSENYGYQELRSEIIEQANKVGIKAEDIDFPYSDNFTERTITCYIRQNYADHDEYFGEDEFNGEVHKITISPEDQKKYAELEEIQMYLNRGYDYDPPCEISFENLEEKFGKIPSCMEECVSSDVEGFVEYKMEEIELKYYLVYDKGKLYDDCGNEVGFYNEENKTFVVEKELVYDGDMSISKDYLESEDKKQNKLH